MTALSIRQPYAWAICIGAKDVENRSWRTDFRGRFLVHAGIKVEQDAVEEVVDLVAKTMAWSGRVARESYAARGRAGGMVGSVVLVDCVTTLASPWFYGPYGFKLADARFCPFEPCRGKLGFFKPEFDWPAADEPDKPEKNSPDLFAP